ncbi:MAG TPA: hypothetical protein VFB22_02035 [Candidatus Baltobacteraceae bacterium]|nr:hypothetical protein [Candidatus Baltobacteraceae bacterium]
MRAGNARLLFCLAASIVSAALADPLVESLSNSGAFGPGRFTDHSNGDVLPALGAGLLLATLFVFGLVRRTFVAAPLRRTPAWLHASHAALPVRAAIRLLPATFALQIATLFVAESVEQLAVAGHLLGGTVWLGGPAFASLSIHATVGLAVVVVLARLLDWIARGIVDVIVSLRRLVLAWDSLSPLPALLARFVPPVGSQAPARAAAPGRAPPTLRV